MENPILHINKQFESRIRLGIMSVLMVSNQSSFNELKDYLGVTDGNLSSHLRALEIQGYLEVSKQFLGRKPLTTYEITEKGRRAFREHLSALENLISSSS